MFSEHRELPCLPIVTELNLRTVNSLKTDLHCLSLFGTIADHAGISAGWFCSAAFALALLVCGGMGSPCVCETSPAK